MISIITGHSHFVYIRKTVADFGKNSTLGGKK